MLQQFKKKVKYVYIKGGNCSHMNLSLVCVCVMLTRVFVEGNLAHL